MLLFTTFIHCVMLIGGLTSAIPQELDWLEEGNDVSSRSRHGKKLQMFEIYI